MTRWMDYVARANPDYLRATELGNSYSGWPAPGDDRTPHEGTSGFGLLELRPHPDGSLTFARGSCQSVRGLVGAWWSVSGSSLSYQVSAPPNATATVHVLSAAAWSVRDGYGGSPLSVGPFPCRAGVEKAVFHIGPGTHSLSGPAPLMPDLAGTRVV